MRPPVSSSRTARQFCCVCGLTTAEPVTEVIDQRTPAEVAAGRIPILRMFHYCPACAPDPCPVCGGDHDRSTREDSPECYDAWQAIDQRQRAMLARQLAGDAEITGRHALPTEEQAESLRGGS